jgi:hypothetical protein
LRHIAAKLRDADPNLCRSVFAGVARRQFDHAALLVAMQVGLLDRDLCFDLVKNLR